MPLLSCRKIFFVLPFKAIITSGKSSNKKIILSLYRGKLRGFNIITAVVKAEKEGRLGEFLVKAYYKAAKIKFNVNDLQGPYVKIQ